MSSSTTKPTRAAARILRYARRHAGLTQRELAARSGVPQETIARIETARTSPRFDTLALLLDATGSELEVVPRLGDGVDRTLIRHALELEPMARLEQGRRAAAGMVWLRDAYQRSAARGD
jgi:transcriptional regulator with XRE-family HTH domain